MLIPNKFNGYFAGRRTYFDGGSDTVEERPYISPETLLGMSSSSPLLDNPVSYEDYLNIIRQKSNNFSSALNPAEVYSHAGWDYSFQPDTGTVQRQRRSGEGVERYSALPGQSVTSVYDADKSFLERAAPVLAVLGAFGIAGAGLPSLLGAGTAEGVTAASLGELGINTAALESAGVVGAGTEAGAGIAGLTGDAAELAAMGIDPQALAAYGGDVASNIGAGSSGISASTALRAANTVRKLAGGGEEESKGIDPKLASALGSLVGMGIGGSSDNTAGIPKYSFTRKVLPIDTTRRPGSAAQRYFEDSYTKLAAGGGISGLKSNEYKAGGRYLAGPGDGMSDNIKANIDGVQEARLADGEFVIPADVVSHIGNGSSNAGAKKLHKMMDRIRHARTGNPKQGKQIKAEKFLPA